MSICLFVFFFLTVGEKDQCVPVIIFHYNISCITSDDTTYHFTSLRCQPSAIEPLSPPCILPLLRFVAVFTFALEPPLSCRSLCQQF